VHTTQLSLLHFIHLGFAVYLCHTAPISFIYACAWRKMEDSPLNLFGQLYIQFDDFTCLHVPGELLSDRFQQYITLHIHTRNKNKKHCLWHNISQIM
jgi:hypothetical protein